jgi:hypothetical protein
MSLYSWFKAAVLTLLACNAAVFAEYGTANEALDSMAWFVLLLLFEVETGFGARVRHPRAGIAIRAIRLVAAFAVAIAAIGYVRDREWLEAINAWLWIGVVALLELEVRQPRALAAHRTAFAYTAAALYGGLAVAMLAWAVKGEWFDAYDALLWLVAFATIELNVLRAAARSGERAAEVGNKA